MFVGVVGPYVCIALLASAVHLFPGLTFVICNHQTNHVRSVTRLISLLLINMPLNFCLRLFLDLSFVYIEWCICFYSECLNFLSGKHHHHMFYVYFPCIYFITQFMIMHMR